MISSWGISAQPGSEEGGHPPTFSEAPSALSEASTDICSAGLTLILPQSQIECD